MIDLLHSLFPTKLQHPVIFILQHDTGYPCKNLNIKWIIHTFIHVKQANFALRRQLNLYKYYQ